MKQPGETLTVKLDGFEQRCIITEDTRNAWTLKGQFGGTAVLSGFDDENHMFIHVALTDVGVKGNDVYNVMVTHEAVGGLLKSDRVNETYEPEKAINALIEALL